MTTFQTVEFKLTEQTLTALGFEGKKAWELEESQFEGKTLDIEGQTFTLTKTQVDSQEHSCGYECCGIEGWYLTALGMLHA